MDIYRNGYQKLRPSGVCLAVWAVVGLVIAAVLLMPSGRGIAAPQAQSGLPVDGWVVCADLGTAMINGQLVQVMRLCNGSDWIVDAYCLEPQQPIPPLGEFCSMVGAADFWCGDPYQLLRQYQIQQTPAATRTPTVTATATSTATPAATQAANTPSAPQGAVPTATVYVRPHAGGTGTLGPALSLLAAAAGLGLVAAGFLVSRRR